MYLNKQNIIDAEPNRESDQSSRLIKQPTGMSFLSAWNWVEARTSAVRVDSILFHHFVFLTEDECICHTKAGDCSLHPEFKSASRSAS